jgi:hypothetical protein
MGCGVCNVPGARCTRRARGLPRFDVKLILSPSVLPGVTVRGYEGLLPKVRLLDPDDRHVVASAIAAGAFVILSWNLRDFPGTVLVQNTVQRMHFFAVSTWSVCQH